MTPGELSAYLMSIKAQADAVPTRLELSAQMATSRLHEQKLSVAVSRAENGVTVRLSGPGASRAVPQVTRAVLGAVGL